MVNLLAGPTGSGKTQKMMELANEQVKACKGNPDEYIGFLYGMYSSNLDLECVFIDGLMKHTGINLEDVPGFITRLKQLSAECGIDFYVSLSAEKDSLTGDAYEGCTFLN